MGQKLINSIKMEKKYFFKIVTLLILLGFSNTFVQAQKKKSSKDYVVEIITSFGKISMILYDDTPTHKANFIRLIKKKFYKDLLFHRVMKGFMIQGGDPTSRNAPKGKMLGTGGSEMGMIAAEFKSHLIHKKGALAAARSPNPAKASNACQFYIVHGKKVSDEDLSIVEKRIKMRYTEEQRKTYREIGGAPFLDQNYTVFGEVIKGLDVVDKIADQPKDRFNRPYEDIKMDVRIRKMRKKKITKKYGYAFD